MVLAILSEKIIWKSPNSIMHRELATIKYAHSECQLKISTLKVEICWKTITNTLTLQAANNSNTVLTIVVAAQQLQ